MRQVPAHIVIVEDDPVTRAKLAAYFSLEGYRVSQAEDGAGMRGVLADDPADLLSRVKKGIFAKAFGGGQVDIVSGKFVFSCTEAYLIEDGKLGAPIKGATLIGDGPSSLTKVRGIGNDFALDEGIGICGKGGQSVPAGVGQPTLLVDGLTVGGTAA